MIRDFCALLVAAGGVGTFPARRPQRGGLPALVYHRISGLPDYTLKGPSGLMRSRMQVDCIATRYATAQALADALDAALNGARVVQGDTHFQGVFIDGRRDLFDPASGSDAASRTHAVSIDFTFFHRSLP